MITIFRSLLLLVVIKFPISFSVTLADEPTTPRTRTFQFEYAATIRAQSGGLTRVWIPFPKSSEHQSIEVLEGHFPTDISVSIDDKHGNKTLYFNVTTKPGQEIRFSQSYHIVRSEITALAENGRPSILSDSLVNLYLAPNANVPISGQPLRLLRGLELPTDTLAIARVLYDRVDEHVRYDKSIPGYGNGDSVWVCNSRTGNCTDFHSLFISLARSRKIPSRFEIGFPLPAKRGKGKIDGYHCWAAFFTESHGWVPVDISEADRNPAMKDYYFGNLTENRVTFSIGRDLTLVPKQASESLNYFIYPFVEVDGKPLAQNRIELSLTYTDEVQ